MQRSIFLGASSVPAASLALQSSFLSLFFQRFSHILLKDGSLRISHLEFCGEESLLRVTPQLDFGRLCDGQSHCRAHEGVPEYTETSRTPLTRFSQAISQEHATMEDSTYACGRDVSQATIQIHLPSSAMSDVSKVNPSCWRECQHGET